MLMPRCKSVTLFNFGCIQEPPQRKRMGRPPKQNPAPETVKRNIRRTKKQARETSGSQPSVPK